jgi:regulatory protein
MAAKRKYPPLETVERIKSWCDRQERAHSEVRRKLTSWGVYGEETENIIAELISSDFLNEERYARAFARGKSRLKAWGWRKIKSELKARGISDYSLKMAREEIDEDEYQRQLIGLLEKKANSVKASNEFEKRQKIYRYLTGKGYAMDEIRKAWEVLHSD